MKTTTWHGTWNVRTMYEAGKVAQITKETRRCNIQDPGISESRWNGSGLTKCSFKSRDRIIYFGHEDETQDHTLTQEQLRWCQTREHCKGYHGIGASFFKNADGMVQQQGKKTHCNSMVCTNKHHNRRKDRIVWKSTDSSPHRYSQGNMDLTEWEDKISWNT